MKAVLISILGFAPSFGALVHAHTPTNSSAPLHGLPPGVRFGLSLAQTRAALSSACPKMTVREIKPAFLDHVKDRQMQIDCDGLNFRGKQRHAEFVIGDDRLVMIWLMVGPQEETAVVNELATVYGEPKRPNPNYWTYPKHHVAFRRDKSEILFYAPEVEGDVAEDLAPATRSAPKSGRQ
jgi:hypothetical protein